MIVLDASVIIRALLFDGPARELMGEAAAAIPHLADSEVMNVLRDLERRGRSDADGAARLVREWAAFGVQRFGSDAVLDRVWELRHNLSAYDATYVALAELLECELATADGRLARAPGPRCPIRVVTG